MTRSYVDNDTFIFASDVDTDGGYRATIAVQWFSFSFRPNPSSLIPIDRFTASRPEVSEVWFLFPRDVEPSLRLLAKLDEYEDRASHLSLLSFRFFAVEGDGRWLEVEIGATPLDPTIDASQRTISQIRADGMRQIFRDTEALATASSGFHFERPGRGHSVVFMRTSQTVTRSQHAYFLAAALLRHVSPSDGSRLFADTGGILPLLHAVADLWVRLAEHTGDVIVDSFGSYEGYENNLRIVEGRDWVIISSSTSGSLSRTLIESSYAQFDRTITLYYLSSVPPTPDMGRVLCDLTLPAAHERESVRDARMLPPLSYRVDASQECGLCAEGSRSIELIGDGFFPAPTSLKLRMPSRIDRPLNGKRERVGPTGRNFDHEDYFSDFYGLGVIVGPSSNGDDPTVSAATQYGVSTRLGHLVAVDGAAEGESIRKKLLSKARQVLRGASPLGAVVALADEDSRNLAQFVGKEIMGDAGVETAKGLWTWGLSADDPPLALDKGLARIMPGSTLLVCAGTLGSGRALLALSRELRVLPASVETRYLVSVSHPESVNSQEIFLQSLGLRGSSLGSRIEIGWQLPREPRSPGARNAWDAEWTLLRAAAETLAERWPEFEGSRELDAIDARTRVLSEPPDTLLFAAPDFREDNPVGIPSINPKFALWPFDWDEHDSFKLRSRRPSQPEIYATIAHFLYESRNMNPLVGSHASGARRHGHAINPAIFDRLNDPQIQAAILRAVEPGELDYHADLDASRTAAEILGFVVAHVNDEGGQAAYEFLLSVAHGIYFPNGMGMRLHEAELRARMALIEDRTETFSALPPLCAALARAISFRIAPAE